MKNEELFNEPRKDLKKPLIYATIAFLIFIIGVIGYAIIKNTSTETKKDSILAETEIKKQKTSTFKELPVEEAIKPPKEEFKKPNADIKLQNIVKEKSEENKTKTTNKVTQKEVKPAPKTQPQKQTKTQPAKEVKTSAKEVKTSNVVKSGKYYIQVAALLKNSKPNEKFIQKLKKYGYNITTKTTYIVKNNEKIKVTKLLVGPFSDLKTAKEELQKIKKITKNAFIYKAK